MHFRRIRTLCLLLLLLPLSVLAASENDAQKAKAEKEQKYLRVKTDEKRNPTALDTAIVSYSGKDKEGNRVDVDLVGVIHIGDKSYYEELNKRFKSYDAVLYELVAPEGTVIPKGGGDKKIRHPLAAFQRGMQSMLGLDFQLDHIDYTKKNFIHADMSPEEFAKSMKKREESFLKMFLRMLKQSAAMQGQPGTITEADLLAAMFSKDRSLMFRRLMAKQFEQMELIVADLNGPDGSTIITERNKKALSVMKREIGNGKKRLAIFYGAGHLPDMDKRMRTEFKMQRGKTEWLTAWSMQPPVKPATPPKKADESKQTSPSDS